MNHDTMSESNVDRGVSESKDNSPHFINGKVDDPSSSMKMPHDTIVAFLPKYIELHFGREVNEREVNPKYPEFPGHTPLFEAIYKEDVTSLFLICHYRELLGYDDDIKKEMTTPPSTMTADKILKSLPRRLDMLNSPMDEDPCSPYTPLGYAAERGNVSICGLLIQFGAEVNKEDGFGETPLCFAAEHEDVLKLLLMHGADANKYNKWNEPRTPLDALLERRCTCTGTCEEKQEAKQKLSIMLPHCNNKTLWSYLEWVIVDEDDGDIDNACFYKIRLILEELVNRLGFADLPNGSLQDEIGVGKRAEVMLTAAARCNSLDIMTWLCERRVLSSKIYEKALSHVLNVYGLHEGMISRLAMVSLLLKTSRTEPNGLHDQEVLLLTVWCWEKAMESNVESQMMQSDCAAGEIVDLLVSRGADVNFCDNFLWEYPPLLNATRQLPCDYSHESALIKSIVKAGANVHAEYDMYMWNDSKTALHAIAHTKSISTAKLLLDYGANIDERDHIDRTPLHVAIDEKHIEMAQFLIDNGADINLRFKGGITALQSVAMLGEYNPEGSSLLAHALFQRSDLDVKGTIDAYPSDYPYTALGIATMHGLVEMAQLLIQHGANVNAYLDLDLSLLTTAVIQLSRSKDGTIAKEGSNATITTATRFQMVNLLVSNGAKNLLPSVAAQLGANWCAEFHHCMI